MPNIVVLKKRNFSREVEAEQNGSGHRDRIIHNPSGNDQVYPIGSSHEKVVIYIKNPDGHGETSLRIKWNPGSPDDVTVSIGEK